MVIKLEHLFLKDQEMNNLLESYHTDKSHNKVQQIESIVYNKYKKMKPYQRQKNLRTRQKKHVTLQSCKQQKHMMLKIQKKIKPKFIPG